MLTVFLFYAGYTNVTVPILITHWLTYGKKLTAAVNMQVAKQQVSVKGANNSPFLNPCLVVMGSPFQSLTWKTSDKPW